MTGWQDYSTIGRPDKANGTERIVRATLRRKSDEGVAMVLDSRAPSIVALPESGSPRRGDVGSFVSLQIAILKVLSSHPDGRASVSAIKSDLAVLTASGRDWNERVKRLAERAPNLDIFVQRYVLRDEGGWSIAASGRDFLRSIERPLIDDVSDRRIFPDDEFGFGREFLGEPRPAARPAMPAMAPPRAYQPRYPIRY